MPVVGSFIGKDKVNIVCLSEVSDLTSDILSTLSLKGSSAEDVAAELLFDKVDKLIMIFSSSCGDNDSFRS